MSDVQFRPLHEQNVQHVADFIAFINSKDTAHIGYCGRDRDEIANFIKNELTDIPYTASFVCAYRDEQIVGVVGFDADLEDQSAEIWGPFVQEGMWDIVHDLWNEMMNRILPDAIEFLYMFPNVKNERVVIFAEEHGFTPHSKHVVLTFSRTDHQSLPDVAYQELTNEYVAEMIELHDRSFPEAYYSGAQIMERIEDNRKVLIVTDGNRLLGYIYVEAEPEFGDGSIEFFAVNESERGKGLGRKLLTAALQWFLTFATIDEITLSVNVENKQAIRLYQMVGFKQAHELQFLTNE